MSFEVELNISIYIVTTCEYRENYCNKNYKPKIMKLLRTNQPFLFPLTLFWTGSGRTLYWTGGGGILPPGLTLPFSV